MGDRPGARVITLRNGPVFTPEGTNRRRIRCFDPFWARIGEAGIVVAPTLASRTDT